MVNNLLRKISNTARKEKVQLYLVGGCLRSLVLGLPLEETDVDIVVSGAQVYPFVKEVACTLHSTLIPLDEGKGVFRVAVEVNKPQYIFFDYTAPKGNNIEEELHLLTELFPEIQKMRATDQNYYHGEDVWNHCLRTYRILERYINSPPFVSELVPKVKRRLEENLTPHRKRKHLLKFFALFHSRVYSGRT